MCPTAWAPVGPPPRLARVLHRPQHPAPRTGHRRTLPGEVPALPCASHPRQHRGAGRAQPSLGAQRGPDSSVRSGSAFSPRLELSLGKSCLGWDLKASVLKKKNKSLRVGGRQQPGAALAGMEPPLAEAPQALCPRVPGAPGRRRVPPAWHQAQALGGGPTRRGRRASTEDLCSRCSLL